MPPDSKEQEVTLAIIQNDILHLTETVKLYLENAKKRDERIEDLNKRLTKIEPIVCTISEVMKLAMYAIVAAAIGGIAWAIVQSGALLP